MRSSDRLHQYQLEDPVGSSTTPLLTRSVLGLIVFWNNLEKDVVFAPTVKDFQSRIVDMAREAVGQGCCIDYLWSLKFIYV